MSSEDKTRLLPRVSKAEVGTELSGIYRLDQHIASGGMGEVYLGHNIHSGDRVAIKIVLPEFARDETILSLFRKEARILSHLSHDALVHYHVFTIDPGIGRPYLAMEFVDGNSLFDVLSRGALPPNEVRRLAFRLASGLSAVHEAGAIHRDLSPDNIILPGGKVERAKIIDFGIARSGTVGGETLIGGRFAGKYNYVSPEQLGLYGSEVTERSDIYSLGLVLAAALVGKPLDMGGSQLEVLDKRRSIPDLSGIDHHLRPLIEAMLEPDPADRPASMAEVAEMAREGMSADAQDTRVPRAGNAASPARVLPHAKAPSSARPAGAARAPVAPPARGRLVPLLLAGGALVALVLLAFVGSRFLASAPEEPSAPPVAIREPTPEPPKQAPEPAEPATAAVPPKLAPAAPAAVEPAPAPLPAEPPKPPPAGSQGGEVAMRPATPSTPPAGAIDGAADRIAWLKAYRGGDCFYATAISATNSATEIEGFGTNSRPFEELLSAFKTRFDQEPDIDVRPIDATQCEVTRLLGTLGAGTAKAPHLTLDRTAVPDGSPVSGTLETRGGTQASLLLIDHKGMAFDLTKFLRLTGDGKASFSIPIGLGPADRAAGKAVPQIVLALTGPSELAAATLTGPTPASVVLPKILAEIAEKGPDFAATAKYFRLGG